MLKSFYKYLVEELVLGYFKKYPIEKGSRYFLIIENEDHRNGIIDAIRSCAETIILSGIYQNQGNTVLEEPYSTLLLRPQKDAVGLIVGYDKTSTEDYLTTIRNSVGIKGGKYEDYAVLFILSDSTSSILSSINTTVRSLQSIGFPLHSQYIIHNIEQKAKDKLSKDLELTYFKKHLEKISEYISDGICNLFDFQHALSVLSEGTLKGHYNEIDFFNDKTIYNVAYKPTDNEMRSRVEKNHEIYRKVADIMNGDDPDIDKSKLLGRFLDEKLSNRISNSSNWKDIDFQEFLDSERRKSETANLELLEITLPSEDLMTSMVLRTTGNKKKKSVSYIIICDESGATESVLKITFNKEIKKATDNIACSVNGQTMKVIVKDNLVRQSVGLNDNHHDFYILRLPCNKSFFKDINQSFSFNKNSEISVDVPEECEELFFGNGKIKSSIPLDGMVEWTSDILLHVPVSSDEEQDKIEFKVDFNGRNIPFVLKLNVAKPLPPVGPKEFPKENTWHLVSTGVSNEEETRGVYSYWRKYLEWEKAFVDNECSFISCFKNELSMKPEMDCKMLNLPMSIRDALISIYDYYKGKDTVPSLCPYTEELKSLYTSYYEAVCNVIDSIPNNRCMTFEEYNVTKLGIVEYQNKIYLSPFHPINVAYTLEYYNQYDNNDDASFAKKLLSPFYLIPFLYYDSLPMRPYTDKNFSDVKNWLSYEGINSKPQERINDISTKMVWTKMDSFIRHFGYLFQDKDCPIIISAIGFSDDTNIVRGVVEFIKHQYSYGVQKIEIHEYVDNLMEETFFEKLNRLDSVGSIIREFESQNLKVESKGEYTSQEIIHQLFTRVSFYKHALEDKTEIDYCHIAFYQMDTGSEFIRQVTNDLRTELSFNGLISIPSTINKNDTYIIGYGTNGMKNESGFIHPMVRLLNNLYANEEHEGNSVYSSNTCVAKRYKFGKSTLLNSIYEHANWVTFINPEVDINFFYKQNNLYVVHYTDQYTINAKYDSITVTKHIDQYANMLRLSYEQYALSKEHFQHFNETMMNYFNCLNGSWMLEIVNKTEVQIREKMSIVAACIAMLRFMRRNENIIWIPMSLEEILRVTGSIGLPQEYIFSKKSLGAKGAMSDDLLMMGLDKEDPKNLKLYMYPVEVKASKNNSMSEKGGVQVSQTFRLLKQHLYGEKNFIKNIYRTFFASQFLTNAEKLNANSLLSDDLYSEIEKCRFDLLNLNYSLEEQLPVKEMGNAAVVSFYSSATQSLVTSIVDNVPVCEIHFSEHDCVQFVSDFENDNLSFLKNGIIQIDEETRNCIDNPIQIANDDCLAEIMDLVSVDDDSVINTDVSDSSPIQQIEEKDDKVIARQQLQEQAIRLVVGHSRTGNREIVFEPNNTKMVSHPNMGIIGTMGTGKTQFARSVIAQLSKEGVHNVGGRPIGILVFDYKGDYKDEEFLNTVGGKCYKFKYPFNPLKLVVNDEVAGMNLPAITADRISDSFAKAYGLGLKQQSNIKQVIIETYADAGITKDPETWNNPVPTMEQVIDKYFDNYDANDKAYALFDKLRDYTIFTTDNSSCVSLFEWLDSVRVIDLTLYPDDTKKVIVSLILDLFYAEMRQLGGSRQKDGFRELRALIMVDEAHQFLKKDFNSFRSIISEGRMFGVGMILSTQNVSDFKSAKEDYSQFILSWVIHHVNSISKSEIASIFGASDSNGEKYMDYINKAKLFESVCKIGSRVEGIRDLPFFELVKQDERFNSTEDN